MPNTKKITLKWEVQRRQEEIELRAYWHGHIHRRHLIDTFGISPQQASADLGLYKETAPDNLVFNQSLKRYEVSSDFKPIYIETNLDDYLSWNKEFHESVFSTIPKPHRRVNPVIIKRIVNALHANQGIEIVYQSMSTQEPTTRRITPHTLVFDGFRYHVRAYCGLRSDFRDFVLGRVLSTGRSGEPSKTRHEDEKWNTLIPLRIGPHPGLSPMQRQVIEQDFNMHKGELLIRVREAMLIYTLTQLRLDQFVEQRDAKEQQIILLNPAIIPTQN
jgi:hypothetical protein